MGHKWTNKDKLRPNELNIWVLSQGRQRSLEWDHPVTEDEAGLNSFLISILAGQEDAGLLEPTIAALDRTRAADAKAFQKDPKACMERHYARLRGIIAQRNTKTPNPKDK